MKTFWNDVRLVSLDNPGMILAARPSPFFSGSSSVSISNTSSNVSKAGADNTDFKCSKSISFLNLKLKAGNLGIGTTGGSLQGSAASNGTLGFLTEHHLVLASSRFL
ncbi:hypothetical protein D3C86_1149360 [compost metagenome]